MDASQPFSNEIKQYLSLLWRWAWLLALLAILGGGLTFYYSLQQPKIYQASATVMIDQQQFTNNNYYETLYYSERLSQTYTQMMVQQPTLEGVIQELGLNISVNSLRGMLSISVVPDTQLLLISIQDTDPVRAADIVNTIGTVFARKNAELQASRYQDTKSGLGNQLLSTDQQIQETIQSLNALATAEDEYVTDILQIQLAAYQDVYQGLLKQIFELETQPPVSEPTETETGETVTGESPIVQQMALIEAEIINISTEIEALGWLRGAEYDLLNIRLSVYKSLYQQLLTDLVFSAEDMAAIAGDSGTDISALGLNLTPDIETLSAQLEVAGERIQELTTEIGDLGGSNGGVERDRLESNLVLYRQTYANLVQSFEQTRLAEIQNTTRVELVQSANPPTGPILPDVMKNTMLGAIVGLMFGAGVAFLIELLDDTVKGPEEIMRRLELPVLGYITRMEEDGLYPVSALEPRSPLAESFRSLRTNIQYASIDRPIYSLMITSPTPKDGKSTVAANLGVVLAQGQHRVSLIDADLRRPFQHKIFDLPNRNGLTDALIQPGIDINDYFKDTKIDNLSVLTTGDLPPNPAELVGSDKMLDLIRSLQNIADIIIIDTPPVMAVTDPVVLSINVDGVIIVLRPGVTKLDAAIHTVEQLRQVGANILGVVLNDAKNKGSRYSQYYKGYYYQYGQYYGHSPDGKKKKRKSPKKEISEQEQRVH